MVLFVDFECQVVRELQVLLSRAIERGGALGASARRLKMLLAAQLVGRVIPDDTRYPFGATGSET
jgi:hypothetical protein